MSNIKFFIPKPGDTVPVRLHTGEVVDAKYVGPSNIEKCYRFNIGVVFHDGFNYALSSRHKPNNETMCRIVGPSCDLVPS